MLDYQRIVDDIRSSLDSQGADGMDFLRTAAADYSVACDEVNERLHQCGSLLRQGLRSEAIQLSEIEPNLLDVAALLDFPERSDWIAGAARFGIASPTPLLLDVAAELNEAYALEQPLAALLQRHRLLALSHGSLSERVDVLRRLAALDADNPVWEEDLRVFEKERQKEIQVEVEAAARECNTAALELLDEELASPDWKTPPLPELAKSAGVAHTNLRYWMVQSELERLASDLDTARSRFNEEHGRTLRDRWNETIAKSGWQPQQQIADRAARALEWLKERDEAADRRHEHETALQALATAIGRERSAQRLRKRHEAAAGNGPVPADLEERYLSRLAVLDRRGRRRFWLQLAGSLVGGMILVVCIATLWERQHFEHSVTLAVEGLSDMIAHDQFDRADALVRDLPKQIEQDPRVQEAIGAWRQSVAKEKTRQMEFSEKLKTANHWLDQVLKSLADAPGQTVLERLRAELGRVGEDLKGAGALARTEEDRKVIAAAKEFAAQVKERWQGQLDQEFQKQYDEFAKRLTQIERDKSADGDTLKTILDEFGGNLKRWEVASADVSPALLPRITTAERASIGDWKDCERAGTGGARRQKAYGRCRRYPELRQGPSRIH